MQFSDSKPVGFVSVHSREAGRAFYEGVLGLAHLSGDDFGDFHRFGGDALLRLTPMPGFTAGPHPVVGWDVPDIRAAVAELKSKGISLIVYEGMGQDADGIWTAPDGRARVGFFADPFGNVLSIAQH
jgi:catechol 2,3-dioxygenase-like lactoylglutathione lyase family enzyme